MVEFGDVVLTAGKQRKRGSLSWLSPTSSPPPSTLDFRSKTSTKPVTVRLSDVLSLSWARHFDGFTLRIQLQGGTTIKFSGFQEAAYKDIAALAATRQLDVQRESVSTKGTNAGHLDMTGHTHAQRTLARPDRRRRCSSSTASRAVQDHTWHTHRLATHHHSHTVEPHAATPARLTASSAAATQPKPRAHCAWSHTLHCCPACAVLC